MKIFPMAIVLVFYVVTLNSLCDGANNVEMVRNLRQNGSIKSEAVANVMLGVDRKYYCPRDPYIDEAQSLGYRANISAPHSDAETLEILQSHLVPGEKALDVGSGSGYLTALMAKMVGETGKVIGIEHVPELVKLANKNIKNDNPDFLTSGRVKFITGDGRHGYPSEGPYNAIHVGGAVSELPQTLIDQLKPGGRLIVPIGPMDGKQNLTQVDKALNGTTTSTMIMDGKFAPLTNISSQVRKKQSRTRAPRFPYLTFSL